MTRFAVTVGYNVCHVLEVNVRAGTVERACQRAIMVANRSGEGWRSTDGASESYVETVKVAGDSVPVPDKFTELGVLAPELFILWQGLQQVAAIAEDQRTDAAATVEKMRTAARDALWRAWR